MRRAAFAIAAVVLAVVIGEIVFAAGSSTDLVQSTYVNPVVPVAPVEPGSTVCQQPFGITEAFDRVRFNAGTFGKPGPPLFVSVTDQGSRAELASGQVRRGWVDNGKAQDVSIGTVAPGPQVSVCIHNEGRVPTYLYGDYYHGAFGKGPLGVTPTNSTSVAYVDGVPLEGDLALWMHSSKPHTRLSWIPAMFRHAAAFKPPFVGAWTFWLLALLLILGAPLALWAALRSATRSDDPSLPSSRP
ncbi:MAG: hypothetical protein QOC77_3478 [Thermoleophilaceae bacterium]|jgi:hypothetical protein|nr:hypothetical protein [Thermoleophilaceae bacterium]MEA2471081.1 hypothetical protein [Thermoleophilaceae bacterium]